MMITPHCRGERRIARGTLRTNTDLPVLCLTVLILCFAVTGPAWAFETLIAGSNNAKACLAAARLAADHRHIEPQAMAVCGLALEIDGLNAHDFAATHVNRGIVSLCRGDYPAAEQDFDAAIAIMPKLAGAYMNRGAVLIAENRPKEAIEALDRSLELGTPEPERAVFDRALARERLGDVTGAYYDLQKAAQLNPSWDAPAKELAYFQVTRK